MRGNSFVKRFGEDAIGCLDPSGGIIMADKALRAVQVKFFVNKSIEALDLLPAPSFSKRISLVRRSKILSFPLQSFLILEKGLATRTFFPFFSRTCFLLGLFILKHRFQALGDIESYQKASLRYKRYRKSLLCVIKDN
jgi:hypothetical protein